VLFAVRPSVAWFAQRMEAKLAKNDFKDGWINCSASELYEMLQHECKELEEKYRARQIETARDSELHLPHFKDTSNDSLIDECADIANFAMMIADLFGMQHGR
jgi:hypothetical protein